MTLGIGFVTLYSSGKDYEKQAIWLVVGSLRQRGTFWMLRADSTPEKKYAMLSRPVGIRGGFPQAYGQTLGVSACVCSALLATLRALSETDDRVADVLRRFNLL